MLNTESHRSKWFSWRVTTAPDYTPSHALQNTCTHYFLCPNPQWWQVRRNWSSCAAALHANVLFPPPKIFIFPLRAAILYIRRWETEFWADASLAVTRTRRCRSVWTLMEKLPSQVKKTPKHYFKTLK